jgi:hypothetical protein
MTGDGTGRLPDGWTPARVREVSGDHRAVVVDNDRSVTWWNDGRSLEPEVVLAFGTLAVVKAVGDEDWYMGHFEDDGGVLCRAAADLYGALRGL